jgi:hypothetical protein
MSQSSTSLARIKGAIFVVRGQRVLLDADLAALYGVETKALNQALRRNSARFPDDFAFRLEAEELSNLRSQSVTSSVHGGRRYEPWAFTEQGVAMLSSVLRSPRAIADDIEIMRAFVEMRRVLDSTERLARKLESLQRKYDGQFSVVFEAIRELVAPRAGNKTEST